MTHVDSSAEKIAFPVLKPRITKKGVLISAICWLLYATAYSFMVAVSGQDGFWGVYIGQIFAAIIAGLLSVGPWLLIVRRMAAFRWPAIIAAHVIIAPIYSWLSLELFLVLIEYTAAPTVYYAVAEVSVFLFGSNVTTYIVQFALFHAYWIFQRLRIKEKQAIELQALAKESELAALKAQINPHFLFNTLNSMNAMVKMDPEETRNMIMQLGDLLRYALDSSRKDLVTLKEELAFSSAYLKLEGHRFAERLEVQFDVPYELEDVLIPPMVLQPLVENAIKHSISKREEGGKIFITVRKEAEQVRIEVKDIGKGTIISRHVSHSPGIGLSNTSSRLEKRLGPEAALQTEDLSPEGFKVSFKIPYLAA